MSAKKKPTSRTLKQMLKLQKIRFMKTNYKLRNNSQKQSKDLIFFGCNFPGYFPETTKALIDLYEQAGIDFSIDCCGKPLLEARDEAYRARSQARLEALFAAKGVKRVINVCPNCYHYFKKIHPKGVENISIFESLAELGVGKVSTEPIEVYLPCSDRASKVLFEQVKLFFPNAQISFNEVNCCGAGGFNTPNVPRLKKGYSKPEDNSRKMYTYCATCCGMFTAHDYYTMYHLVPLILGTNETVNMDYTKNVMELRKYKRNR